MTGTTTSDSGRGFPDGFVWGAATASYQIEGAAREDGRGESIWDRFSHTPGKILNGDTGDVACDHYHRWREDIALMRELGLAAYRFSVAWPRVLPDGRGQVNDGGLDFYDRLVDGLLEVGIAPWVTLYHWDLPQPLEDAGGWPNRETADAFVNFADVVSRRLGDRVNRWITLNEPWVSAFLGYQMGVHAPGRTDLDDALAASHTLLLAHGRAVPAIRANNEDASVGITLNLSPTYPASPEPADAAAARRYDGYLNRWFLDPIFGCGYPADMLDTYGALAPRVEAGDLETIAVPIDFLGVNYYFPTYLAASDDGPLGFVQAPPEGERTAMGWPVAASGLEELLVRLNREYPTLPLFITENGAAYKDPAPTGDRVPDPARIRYLADHLAAAGHVIAAGVPLRGYFVWSLLDNFEWAFGYDRRFGITHVDFTTQQRTIKDSGRWYARTVRENRLAPVEE
ncbi:MAG: GH1 family beta-glucosidase [Chloroflexota bacterium]|nr:GH1 family beta-glucosidase [Chloroflexota bacterium]